MPYTPFDYRLGLDQGRVQPTTRTISPEDSPGPAVLVALAIQLYALEDQDNLLIAVNGGPVQNVIFDAGDFIDITQATAAEVGAVLQAQLTGVVADVTDSRVRLTSIQTGLSASFSVTGGTGQSVIQFPTGVVSGTQGQWAFVLGHESPGQTFSFTTGDYTRVQQTALFNDALLWRMRGAVKWRRNGNEAGSSWAINWRVGGVSGAQLLDIDQTDPLLPDLISLDDIVVNVSGLAAVATEVQVELVSIDTGGAGDFNQELPAVFIDFVTFDETAAALEVANRFPSPGMVGVTPTLLASVEFWVLNTTANTLDLSNTRVMANGVVVYDAGAFVGAFTGTVTPTIGPANRDTRFVMNLSSLGPFTSEQTIQLEIDTQTTGDSLNDSWDFTMTDTSAPQLVAAQGRDKTTVRVFYNEYVQMDMTSAGALNVANYSITPRSCPAVSVSPQSISLASPQAVDVVVDIPLSLNAKYFVQVSNVTDLWGNTIDPVFSGVEFAAFRPQQPAGRSFQLWDRLPPFDQRRDAVTPGRPLRKFILVLQDVVDLLLCDIDRWTEIIDIDLAPEPFLDAILQDLGNPFDFVSLDLAAKRRLARILVDIYKEKGTEPGIINAIQFFLGIQVELDVLNCREYWSVGVHQLSLDTVIGPGTGSPLWYSWYIVSPVILTETQREQMLQIADYMKAAHEHILGIREPGGITTPSSFWRIGVSTINTDTTLGG